MRTPIALLLLAFTLAACGSADPTAPLDAMTADASTADVGAELAHVDVSVDQAPDALDAAALVDSSADALDVGADAAREASTDAPTASTDTAADASTASTDASAPDAAPDACDADTASDPMNCGACGRVCEPPPHGQAACFVGVCEVRPGSCDIGWIDCDTSRTNGCEVDSFNDAMNCGMCGRACPMGRRCVRQSCVAP